MYLAFGKIPGKKLKISKQPFEIIFFLVDRSGLKQWSIVAADVIQRPTPPSHIENMQSNCRVM